MPYSHLRKQLISRSQKYLLLIHCKSFIGTKYILASLFILSENIDVRWNGNAELCLSASHKRKPINQKAVKSFLQKSVCCGLVRLLTVNREKRRAFVRRNARVVETNATRTRELLLCSDNTLVPRFSLSTGLFATIIALSNDMRAQAAAPSCKLHLCARQPATFTPDSLRYSSPLKFSEFRELLSSLVLFPFALASKILTSARK